MDFKLAADYSPAGDQQQAIEKLTAGVKEGRAHQVLLGVTGSGKTYTVANVIANTRKPTLVISHNKTLASQLYQEFKEYFPHNGVGFFISYYDFYQPEAYIPQTDTYIEKETEVNEEIDKLRLQATSLLFSRRDVILVASVSCIYNLGSPEEYNRFVIGLKKGQKINQEEFLDRLVGLHYSRSRMELDRSLFRVRGENIEIIPAYSDEILKIGVENGIIQEITTRPLISGQPVELEGTLIYPAKHYLTNPDILLTAEKQIGLDLKKRLEQLRKENKLLEAQRLEQKVNYDLEMIRETGYVNGIENYSRYFDGRKPGEAPWTLVDYFKYLFGQDYLVVIDESHMTVPQIRGMYQGDLSRKRTLIDFGFRLPAAIDNRPLTFAEFEQRVPQTIYVSATPDNWEVGKARESYQLSAISYQTEKKLMKADNGVVEQLVRPTGLVDPEVIVKPTENQIQDLVAEIIKRKEKKERVLVTTLTKKMAEELANWLVDPQNTPVPLLVHYLHSDIVALERTDILADLRAGKYDVIIGVNLLREGLDLPEVSLVAILDADKQGFLRSKTSLIQTMGRAARNISGQVIMYADEVSTAMREAIEEVERRRKIQIEYNEKHGITPKSIEKPIRNRIAPHSALKDSGRDTGRFMEIDLEALTPGEQKKLIPQLRKEMRQAAANLDFETAAKVRDFILKISA
ncbi:MAG: UvrABC system protein B [Microgenomates group bacterium ADurb.Bin219]|nr:MAG: UvrABC system protein B [Microgenomates group bacterium ADurb.Bin219]